MCAHFVPRSTDSIAWNSQCLFWSEVVSAYASQLLSDCPYPLNRLSFTALDLQRAFTRRNGMYPLCLVDILRHLEVHTVDGVHRVETATHIEERSNSKTATHKTSEHKSNHTNTETQTNTNPLLSGVSSMFSSMFSYLIANDDEHSDEHSYDSDVECAENNGRITADTKVVYLPTMDALCAQMRDLSFYKKHSVALTHSPCQLSQPMTPSTLSISELIEMGLLSLNPCDVSHFLLNAFVYERFCRDVLKLSDYDTLLLRKYLIARGHLQIITLENDEISVENSADSKNVMFLFGGDVQSLTAEHRGRMQMMSLSMTLRHLRLEKVSSETKLNEINSDLVAKLKTVPLSRRKAFLSGSLLLRKKKWMTQRIATLSGSVYNLEQIQLSMEDVSMNSMVFAEMQSAERVLRRAVKESMPSVEEVREVRDGLEESMMVNREMGDVLAEEDGGCEVDEEELEREYAVLEAEVAEKEVKEMGLPRVPDHDVVIPDKEDVQVVDVKVVEDGKKVVMVN